MDVLVSRDPLLLAAWRDGFDLQDHGLRLAGLQCKVLDSRLPKEAMIGFEAVVVPRRNIERPLTFQQQIVPLILDVDLERFRRVVHAPDALAVEVVLEKREQIIYRTQAMRCRAAEQIDTSRHQFTADGVSNFN